MKVSKPTVASSLVVLLVIALTAVSSRRAAAQPSPSPVACDQECLSKVMKDFLSAMTTGKPGDARVHPLTRAFSRRMAPPRAGSRGRGKWRLAARRSRYSVRPRRAVFEVLTPEEDGAAGA
jgi:hypothetical protein